MSKKLIPVVGDYIIFIGQDEPFISLFNGDKGILNKIDFNYDKKINHHIILDDGDKNGVWVKLSELRCDVLRNRINKLNKLL
jgi:hypothetical protein